MPVFDLRSDLSDRQYLLIGRVMVQWSFFEALIDRSIWHILRADPKTGRVITTRMNLAARLQMLRLLAGQHIADEQSNTLIDQIGKFVEDVQPWRNRLAHGLWGDHPKTGECCVIWYTGGKDDRNRVDGQHARAEIGDIRSIVAALVTGIKLANDLERRLATVRGASPDKDLPPPQEETDPLAPKQRIGDTVEPHQSSPA